MNMVKSRPDFRRVSSKCHKNYDICHITNKKKIQRDQHYHFHKLVPFFKKIE
jgi:hypothetical protein